MLSEKCSAKLRGEAKEKCRKLLCSRRTFLSPLLPLLQPTQKYQEVQIKAPVNEPFFVIFTISLAFALTSVITFLSKILTSPFQLSSLFDPQKLIYVGSYFNYSSSLFRCDDAATIILTIRSKQQWTNSVTIFVCSPTCLFMHH